MPKFNMPPELERAFNFYKESNPTGRFKDRTLDLDDVVVAALTMAFDSGVDKALTIASDVSKKNMTDIFGFSEFTGECNKQVIRSLIDEIKFQP